MGAKAMAILSSQPMHIIQVKSAHAQLFKSSYIKVAYVLI